MADRGNGIYEGKGPWGRGGAGAELTDATLLWVAPEQLLALAAGPASEAGHAGALACQLWAQSTNASLDFTPYLFIWPKRCRNENQRSQCPAVHGDMGLIHGAKTDTITLLAMGFTPTTFWRLANEWNLCP